MKDCLVLSSGKNKSSVFNGLQAKLTGSNPVALTTFPQMDCGSKYNDLANNSLKTLSNFKPSIRFWSDFAPKIIREIRSKLPPKSIKVSSKCLVDFSEGDRLCP
jgi:hypothetical protein